MTAAVPVRLRDRTGHADSCRRPFIQWRDVLGSQIGTCSCGAVFTHREGTSR